MEKSSRPTLKGYTRGKFLHQCPMDLKTIFESGSELKLLLHHRSDLASLESSLSTLLKQLNAALLVEDAESSEFMRLAGVIFRFFEGSQTAMADFMNLWEISLRVKSPILNFFYLTFYFAFF